MSGVTVTEGPDDIAGRELSFSKCGEYAESRRTGTPIEDEPSFEERYNHLTGDYYWNREVYNAYHWALVAILLLIPPVGAFVGGFFVMNSITAKPSREQE